MLVTYLRAEARSDSEYDRQRAQSADGVLAAIDGLPGRGRAVEADLTADGAVAGLFDEAERSLGPVSILVNNASGGLLTRSSPAHPSPSLRSPSTATSRSTHEPVRC